MDMCLLCLELRHESVECIYVNSRQWEEDNIEQLIEQHFWPMDSITKDSWLCAPCCYVLNEFHKFYTRIEDAHVDMAIMMKTAQSPSQQTEIRKMTDDFEELIDKDLSNNIKGFNIAINLNDCNEECLSFNQLGTNKIVEDLNKMVEASSMEQAVNSFFHENPSHLDQIQVQISGFDGEQELTTIDHIESSQFFREDVGQQEDNNEIIASAIQVSSSPVDGITTSQIRNEDDEIEGNEGDLPKDVIEESMIDDENILRYQKDPLKKYLFAKVKKIPKVLIEPNNISTVLPESLEHSNAPNEDDMNEAGNKVPNNKYQTESTVTVTDIVTPSPSQSSIIGDDTDTLEVPIDYPIEYKTDINSDDQTDNTSSALDKCKSRVTHRDYDDYLKSQNFKITCGICQELMETFNDLNKHSATAHGKRAYVVCCDRKFGTRFSLVEHVRCHCDPNRYKCKYCPKVLSTRRCQILHEKHVHEKKYTRHTCDICGKSFASAHVLKNHKLLHLSEEEKIFNCEQCGKKFGSNNLLFNHIRSVHMAKYVKICELCGKKLRCREDFDRHMLKHEGVPLPSVTCDVCGLKITSHSALRRHKMLQHPEGGRVQYTCPLCGKISDTISAHHSHIRYKHEMERDYKCSLCNKAFKKLFTLNEHMAGHTKNPLYTCPYCPLQFNSNANMHTHRKRDHPKEWVDDRRNKYSGNLPPNHKPPVTLVVNESSLPADN